MQVFRAVRTQTTDLKWDWYPMFMDIKFEVDEPTLATYTICSQLMHKGVKTPAPGNDNSYAIGCGIILLLRGPYANISDWPAYPPTIPARQARFYDANVTRIDRIGDNIVGVQRHYYPAVLTGQTTIQPGCWALEAWAQAQTDVFPGRDDLVTMVQDGFWGCDLHRFMLRLEPC